MEKLSYIPIFLILFFFSCNQNNDKEDLERDVYYYPEEEKFKQNSNQRKIFIDSISNYGDLLNEIDKVACQDSVPVIVYSTKEEWYELIPWYECSEYNIISSPTFRSRIFIQNDSILTNFDIRHSIDSLETIFRRHFLNKGKDFNYSDSPAKAGIEIYLKNDIGSKEVKKLLLSVSEEFNNLNEKSSDTLYLNIFFRDSPLKRVPPPPPY